MARLRELQLEPYSLALARRILAAFPRWEPFVGRAEREEGGLRVNVLQLELPSANPDVCHPLRVVAEPDRLVRAIWFPLTRGIVWVFEWADHAYFLPPEAWRKDPAAFDPIVAWLREFIAEERVSAARYDGDSVVAFGAPRLA